MGGTAYVLNGSNLNLLGERQPEPCGRGTLSDVEAACRRAGDELDLAIRFHWTKRECELIDWMDEARDAGFGTQGCTVLLRRLAHLIGTGA